MPLDLIGDDTGALVRAKMDAAINALNDVRDAALPAVQAQLTGALQQEARDRVAGIAVELMGRNEAVATLRTDMLAGDAAVSRQVSALPPADDGHPSEGPRCFTYATSLAALSGEGGALPPLPALRIAFGPAGGAVRLTGPGIVASRAAIPIEPGRLYHVRGRALRIANPSDPNGDDIRFGVLWLDQAKNIMGGDPGIVADISSLSTGSGPLDVGAYLSASAGPRIRLVPPVGAAYFRRFAQTFGGGDGATDIAVLATDDVTGFTVPPLVTTDLVGRMAALEGLGLGPAMAAVQSAVNAPSSVTYATRSDAAAANVPATVTTLMTRGATVPGDGGSRIYRRLSGSFTDPATQFVAADGSLWGEVDETFIPPGGDIPVPRINWTRETVALSRYLPASPSASDVAAALAKATAQGWAVRMPGDELPLPAGIVLPYHRTLYASRQPVRLVCQSTTGDMLKLTGRGGVQNLFLDSYAQRVGGNYLVLQDNEMVVDGLRMEHGWDGILTTGTDIQLKDVTARDFKAGRFMIRVEGGFAVYIDRFLSDHDPQFMPQAGINVRSVGDLTLTRSNIIHCGVDLLVNPGPGQVVAALLAYSTFFDTALRGMLLTTELGGAIVRTRFYGCESSSHILACVALIATGGLMDGILFESHQARTGQQEGFFLAGPNMKSVRLLDPIVAGCGTAALSATNGAKFFVREPTFGPEGDSGPNGSGAFIDVGHSDWEIKGGNLTGNTGASMSVAASSMGGRASGVRGYKTENYGSTVIAFDASGFGFIPHGLVTTPVSASVDLNLNTDAASQFSAGLLLYKRRAGDLIVRLVNPDGSPNTSGISVLVDWWAKI